MEKISWADRVRNEKVLVIQRFREKTSILLTKRRTDNWIRHIWHRNVFGGEIGGGKTREKK